MPECFQDTSDRNDVELIQIRREFGNSTRSMSKLQVRVPPRAPYPLAVSRIRDCHERKGVVPCGGVYHLPQGIGSEQLGLMVWLICKIRGI